MRMIAKTIKCVAVCAAALACQAAALGAGDGYSRTLTENDVSIPWWSIVIMVVATGATAVVAFRNSKRTHLD
jgi:hypothetical protein